ncbi:MULTISPECIES: LacI family DNA-binding transcriptional regulator [unclassified Sphingomonas]|uniref:LacI family DNA-binding transcriptional regulator n=1 Tax=unclassified Sphingomonas TaxID=196159 RepID=UPI0006F2DF1B|nr:MULTISPECIES: LacI family DNA-binding transcriptional regulator [unclassified Sphingomonas]KQM61583.1 LacI family transcriptional regulator [Sphingomonas sp. Leaf16]KQN12679.1 LacI family transcriptional regulator [Sphingomonas sp. Leaf29]KQN19159.1 LacI family transcriptional regulator [Sphingomonas sp. Leaf32]
MKRTGQPTINDVARLAGVSKKTVSRVINQSPLLNGETRDKVQAVIAELGYIPNPQARALALRRNFLIALIHDNPNAQMVLRVQQGLLEVLRDTEFELLVHPVDRGAPDMRDEIRRFLERQRPYGVMLLPPISENDALAALCAQIGCRYVRMGSAAFDDPGHMVSSNDREAVRGAIDHLFAAGHRRICMIAGPHGFRSAFERQQGYEEAMEAAGLGVQRTWIAQGDYTFESGMRAAERLLDLSPRPTAIFSSNDEMAAGALHIARQRGLDVPENLSIVGFDDTSIASHLWPPLTTVRWPIATMARAAALKLIGEDDDEPDADAPEAEATLFVSTLIRRASVAKPQT